MFKQNNKKEAQNFEIKEVETIIGPSVRVRGDFESKGNIIVEGILEGSVKTNGNILIGDNAQINGNVKANDARVGGEITGNIKSKGTLEIASSAKITGDIVCSILTVESGAKINGKCTMNGVNQKPNEPQKTEEPQKNIDS